MTSTLSRKSFSICHEVPQNVILSFSVSFSIVSVGNLLPSSSFCFVFTEKHNEVWSLVHPGQEDEEEIGNFELNEQLYCIYSVWAGMKQKTEKGEGSQHWLCSIYCTGPSRYY